MQRAIFLFSAILLPMIFANTGYAFPPPVRPPFVRNYRLRKMPTVSTPKVRTPVFQPQPARPVLTSVPSVVHTDLTRAVSASARTSLLPSNEPLWQPPAPPFEDEPFPMADAVFKRLEARALANLPAAPTEPDDPLARSHLAETYATHQPPDAVLHVFMQEKERLTHFAQNEPALFTQLEGQLFDSLCKIEKDVSFPRPTLTVMQKEFVKQSLVGRVRWPDIWATAEMDVTRWPYVHSEENVTAAPMQFQPDLVVIVINDDEEVVSQAIKQLRPYAGKIFSAYDSDEILHIINLLKYQHLRPHYIISDGMIGRFTTDQDIKKMIKQSFPELADTLGFVLLSDGFLDFYARNNGYVSCVTRIGDHFTNISQLIANLEEKYHIQDAVNQIPLSE